ncbi:hypothetical protein PPYR_13976 [Photinus pyralis]|uniref:Ras-GEF domain-containing protein n=1 Tax=Photinus pyralis TaxID=7054 RepID=A0A5N4A3V8_PHOPY|nr:ras-specific guanine nucleotide-releasing factor RalGPS2-like isoform X2 [Photinus pyralis]KAB0792015.1 hypothetical protein PPYR_13976 [Photinus pyralis]
MQKYEDSSLSVLNGVGSTSAVTKERARKLSDADESRLNAARHSLVPASTQVKTQSLPNSSRSSCGNIATLIFDPLRVPPEDFATQLVLLDVPVFFAIKPDELTSCAWNKKNKLTVTPNVVAFTRRFNHVSFWTVQEILSRPTPKQRADMMGHFIRIAKKLYELNDLHSLFAIISALQSASVYRLSKTWGGISKKEKQSFDKLAEVFSDTDNWSNLRKHIESLKLPCIPYLGLYLTDLVYIDMAHPHTGGLESQQRTLKMNNILRVISNYQTSDYSHLTELPHIQNYLHSVRYIEELQKFVEDDQYKLSLKLEPPPSIQASNSKEAISNMDVATIASLNLSPAKASGGSLRLHAITSSGKYIPGHRKCNSLGTKFRSASLPRNFNKQGISSVTVSWGLFGKTHGGTSIDVKEFAKGLHLLDDSELEDETMCLGGNDPPSPSTEVPFRASFQSEEDCTLLSRSTDEALLTNDSFNTMQGCVRRKAILKEGRKPAVASWQRYWLQIWASSLAYFSPKNFKGSRRSDFKSEPCKMMSLVGCTVKLSDNPLHLDTFHIIDHHRGNVYKFKTGSQSTADKWCRRLQHASSGETNPLPANLMSFE